MLSGRYLNRVHIFCVTLALTGLTCLVLSCHTWKLLLVSTLGLAGGTEGALKVASLMGKYCLLCSYNLSRTLLGSVSRLDSIASISSRAPSSGTYYPPSGSWAAPVSIISDWLFWLTICQYFKLILITKPGAFMFTSLATF